MQDPGSEFRRLLIPRRSLNNGKCRPCPAHKYDNPDGPVEERVICVRQPQIPRAMCFICSDCARRLFEGKHRRDELGTA
jgi:hypothetical protein